MAIIVPTRSVHAVFGTFAGASASANATDDHLGPPFGFVRNNDLPPRESGDFEASISVAASAAKHGSLASALGNAHAAIGDVGLSATVVGSTTHGNAGGSVAANAEWFDIVFVHVPSKPFLSAVVIKANLTLDGFITGTASPLGGGVEGRLRITDRSDSQSLPSAPYANGDWARYTYNPSLDVFIDDEVPGAISVTHVVNNGASYLLGYRLDLSTFATSPSFGPSGCGQADCPAHTASISADFSGSLHWGGITSVTDLDGNPIEDWTISSETGFDYSKPFGVPEPSSILLLAIALSALPALRRR